MKRRSVNVLSEIRRVIALEADALKRLHGSVNASFSKAAKLIAACSGKVIVTGIGKSGLIAQKIAATLASTGTPALYLNPAEGLHGGIGLLQGKDTVLAVGKSGESEELNFLLPAIKRLRVKIIALTAVRASTLGRAANIVLLTPITREACPFNLAPTCSTTAALAAGDALAIALMKLRGFRRDHFALLHPGGQLGKRLTLKVKDIMRAGADNPVVTKGATVAAMLSEMTRKQAGAVSVVDGRRRLIGLVTDHDVRRALERGGNIFSRPVGDIMNPHPTTVAPNTLAAEASELMTGRTRPLSLLPVKDRQGRAVGLLHMHDIRARGL